MWMLKKALRCLLEWSWPSKKGFSEVKRSSSALKGRTEDGCILVSRVLYQLYSGREARSL